jgi:hypothetical protein
MHYIIIFCFVFASTISVVSADGSTDLPDFLSAGTFVSRLCPLCILPFAFSPRSDRPRFGQIGHVLHLVWSDSAWFAPSFVQLTSQFPGVLCLFAGTLHVSAHFRWCVGLCSLCPRILVPLCIHVSLWRPVTKTTYPPSCAVLSLTSCSLRAASSLPVVLSHFGHDFVTPVDLRWACFVRLTFSRRFLKSGWRESHPLLTQLRVAGARVQRELNDATVSVHPSTVLPYPG